MLLLRLYWIAGLMGHKAVWEFLKRRGGPTSSPRLGPRLRLVKAVKAAILAGVVVQVALPFDLLPIAGDPRLLRAVGTVIYTVGLLVAIVARLQLGRNWSDIETPQLSGNHVVVSNGLYGYIRHPIYIGDLALLLGLELAMNSWLVLLVALLIPVVLRRAVLEEKALAQRLPGYSSYARRTKRFIPYVV